VRTGAIIVAAGSGERLGAGIPKALVPVAGLPLVVWSVRALDAAASVGPVVIVAPPGAEREIAVAIGAGIEVHAVVPGGSTRQRSVAAGIAALPADVDAIAVHDAARPLITPGLVERLIRGLSAADGVIAATRVTDTLKRANPDGTIGATVDRAGLWSAQTPQVFRAEAIRSVFALADDAELDSATDCAGMAERRGMPIALVDPEAPNLKVTTATDLRLAEVLLGSGRIA